MLLLLCLVEAAVGGDGCVCFPARSKFMRVPSSRLLLIVLLRLCLLLLMAAAWSRSVVTQTHCLVYDVNALAKQPSAASISYCLVIAASFSKTRTGNIVGMNLYWLLCIPALGLLQFGDQTTPSTLYILSCLLAPGAFYSGIRVIVDAGTVCRLWRLQ